MFVSSCILLSLTVLAAEPAKDKPAGSAAVCELVLEGKHIENLVLSTPEGLKKEIFRPGDKVLLPPGKYAVIEVHLQDGYRCELNPGLANGAQLNPERIALAPDKPFRPGFGAPLNPSVSVRRAGRLLKLDYQLLDGEGRKYRKDNISDQSRPPQFAVYLGDRQIGSGSFEYG